MVGLRSFTVDGLGRLTPITRSGAFQPGCNTAKCQRTMLEDMAFSMNTMFTNFTSGAPVKPSKDEHRVAGLGCTCGFYAYFDARHNPHHAPGNVEALIEGWGTVTSGTRGFRAEKARLVALIVPRRPRRLPFTRRTRAVLLVLSALFIAAGTVMGAVLSGRLAWTGIWFDLIGWLAFLALFNMTPRDPLARNACSYCFDTVRRNYPDVPVYRNRAAALRAHPLTVPSVPTPDTDPEFWTRAS